MDHYPNEISCIKSIKDISDEQIYFLAEKGGNKSALNFFKTFELHHMSVQKRYGTVAAEYYR